MITTTTVAVALVRNLYIYIYIYIEFRSLQFKGLDFIIVVLLCQRKPNEHHYWESLEASYWWETGFYYLSITIHLSLFIHYCSSITVHLLLFITLFTPSFAYLRGGCPLSLNQVFSFRGFLLESFLLESFSLRDFLVSP